jgi:serine/threonine protein kinase
MKNDPVDILNLGGYQVVGRLGRGAMADVYDAVDATGHEVALKVFKAGGGMSYTMLERFRREAEATKILRRHPYILTVYASGHEGDYHYIAMEKVPDSRSLDSFMHRNPPREEILKIGIKIAEALQYSHDHQIIHRDVKPSNVLLDEFHEPMLTDFGVAELTDWPSLTLSGALTGTPMYMAPEQARSEAASPASDVYSLAVVLYEALLHRLPYELPEAASTPVILDAVKFQEPKPPRTVDKTISRDLNYVLLHALRKSPDERYRSAREFAYDLQLVLDGKPLAARWVSPWTRARYFLRRHRTALSGISAFMLLGLVGVYRFREVLSEEASEQLILLARDVSKGVELARQSTTNRTEPEMKAAARFMEAGRWIEARDLLQTAMRINENLELPEPLAEARLELARVEVVLQNSHRGLELYRQVRSDARVSAALRQVAGLEEIQLLLVDGQTAAGREVQSSLLGTPPGPVPELMALALGDEEPGDLDAQAESWRPELQQHLVLARLVRDRDRLSSKDLAERLREMVEAADSPRRWPVPLAMYLQGRL